MISKGRLEEILEQSDNQCDSSIDSKRETFNSYKYSSRADKGSYNRQSSRHRDISTRETMETQRATMDTRTGSSEKQNKQNFKSISLDVDSV